MAAFNIFAQTPTKQSEFPPGTVGGDFTWKLTPTGDTPGDQVAVAGPATFVNFTVDVPTDASYTYDIKVQRVDEGGAALGGSLSASVVVPPTKPPGVQLDVVDDAGVLKVEVNSAA